MKGADQYVVFEKETEWGTGADLASGSTPVLLVGAGLEPNERNEFVSVRANDAFPAIRRHELVKQAVELALTTPIYIDSVTALMEMGEKRTDGELDSFTFGKHEFTASDVYYVGVKSNSMTLRWSAGDLVELTHQLVAKGFGSALNMAAPSSGYPTGMPYKGARVSVSVNGVAAVGVESGEITWNNNLNVGPVGSGFSIGFLDAGFCEVSGRIRAKFTSAAWHTLLRTLTNSDLTSFATVLTFANNTGVTAKNLVVTCATCFAQSGAAKVGDQGETLMCDLEIVTMGTVPTVTYPT
mgnify:CR=1 FL=1